MREEGLGVADRKGLADGSGDSGVGVAVEAVAVAATAAAAAAASTTTAATTTAMSESIPSLAAAATQSRDARMASALGTITHHISPMRPDTDMLCDMDTSLSAPAPVPCMFSTASTIGTQDMYEDDDKDFDDDDDDDDDDDFFRLLFSTYWINT